MQDISYSFTASIIEIWESFKEFIVRFFDNRFQPNNEINYLRGEIEKLRFENNKLLNHIIDLTSPVKTEEAETKNPEPLRKIVNWNERRRELEKQDAERARNLKIEKEVKANVNKSTEQLESELLSGEN